MRDISNILAGAAAGAASGAVVGCAVAWEAVSRSYTGPAAFWTNCGPHIFVPVWLGAAVGLVSKLADDSFFGMAVVAFAGICAGLLVPTVYQYMFYRPFTMSVAFMGIPYAREIVLGGAGAIAAFFWYFSGNKLLS
ncbi:MAG: hypothetical protein NTX59_00660 [Elusimicrobia bacterium]|nr:hypothetical protein [Elusimicrobiota bacterium]